jgi:hypothetical protein
MHLPEDDLTFLRDLVKTSRQRSQGVNWVDRDGTKRQTTLNAAEATRLNGLAHRRGVSTAELLRQAAHLPVARVRPAEPEST